MALAEKAAISVLWTGLDAFVRQAIQFTISIALARLLTPQDFGTIALFNSLVFIAFVIADLGMGVALIQAKEISDDDLDTAFHCTWAASVVGAVLLVVSAPFLARFYNVPALATLAWPMSAGLVMAAIGIVPSCIFSRRLDFKTQMKAGLLASVGSGLTAVLLASMGAGAWALASQNLAVALINTCALWYFVSWRPHLRFSAASFRKLVGFGRYMAGSAIIFTLDAQLSTLVLGKLFGSSELAQYNRAVATQQLPAGFLANVISRMTLPILSSVSDDKERLRRGVRASIRAVMAFTAPSMLGLCAIAEPLTNVLFGKQWSSSVPLLQILCIGGAIFPLHVLNLQGLVAQGRSDLFFRVEMIKRLLSVLTVAATCTFGLVVFAWGQVFLGIACLFINAWYSKKLLGYSAWEQLFDCLPTLAAAVTMAIAVHVALDVWALPDIQSIMAGVALGVLLYGGLMFFFDRVGVKNAIALFLSTLKTLGEKRAA